jgi:hypothetical protein
MAFSRSELSSVSGLAPENRRGQLSPFQPLVQVLNDIPDSEATYREQMVDANYAECGYQAKNYIF